MLGFFLYILDSSKSCAILINSGISVFLKISLASLTFIIFFRTLVSKGKFEILTGTLENF